MLLLIQHIEAGTKWTPFYGRHFQMSFLNENVWIPIKISVKFVPKVSIIKIASIGPDNGLAPPSDKPISEPIRI